MSRLMSIGAMGQVDARRLLAGLVLVMLAVLTMSGCTKSEPAEASVWDMPEVVWDAGAAPSGGAEDSPWAKEFREAQLMVAYVWGTVDSSYPEFVKQFGYDEAVRLGERFGAGEGNLRHYEPQTSEYVSDAPVRWSAQRMLITSVTEDQGGDSAVIEYTYVYYAADNFSEHTQSSVVRLAHHDDGSLTLELPSDLSADFVLAEATPIGDIPTARWATPITKPTLPGEVKMPLPREYYVELGVIDG